MIEIDIVQGTDLWKAHRLGCVTGTRLDSAVGSPAVQKTLMNELIAERMTGQGEDIYVNAAMQYGIDHEDEAVEQLGIYIFADFEKCGMMKSSDLKYFALSPDAVLRDGDKIIGGCEVKNPMSKTHIEYLLADAIPKKYLLQVLGPMILSDDVQSWFFASYDMRNEERPLFVVEAKRENYLEEITAYKTKLIKFLIDVNTAHKGLTIGDSNVKEF